MLTKYHFVVCLVLLVLLAACRSPGTEAQSMQKLGNQPGDVASTTDPPATSQAPGVDETLGATPTVTGSGGHTVTATATATPTVKKSSVTSSPAARTPAPAAPTGGAAASSGDGQPVASSGDASPQIIAFTISPERVNPGDVVTLSWEAAGSSAEMFECLTPDDGHLQHPCSPSESLTIPLAGTRAVTVPNEARYHVEFHLLVKGKDEGMPAAHDSKSAEVACPTTWFFGAPLEFDTSCPEEKVVTSQSAWQTFELGAMMWIASTNDIHTLLNNGGYSASPDAWDSSMPENDPNIVPPDGLYQPVRGFGLVWRNQRDTLGWATAPEFAFNVTYQCSVYRYHDHNCYYQDPYGRIIWRGFFGGWKIAPQ